MSETSQVELSTPSEVMESGGAECPAGAEVSSTSVPCSVSESKAVETAPEAPSGSHEAASESKSGEAAPSAATDETPAGGACGESASSTASKTRKASSLFTPDSLWYLADVGPVTCRRDDIQAAVSDICCLPIQPMKTPPQIGEKGTELAELLERDWNLTPENIQSIVDLTLAQIVRYPGTRPALTFIGYVPYDGGPFFRHIGCRRFDTVAPTPTGI